MSHRNRLFQPSNGLRDVIWLCFEFLAPFAIVEFLLLVLYSIEVQFNAERTITETRMV